MLTDSQIRQIVTDVLDKAGIRAPAAPVCVCSQQPMRFLARLPGGVVLHQCDTCQRVDVR